MGVFDSITLLAADSRLVCAEGHHLYEFQTKDLDCAMQHYYLHWNRLFTNGEEGRHVEQNGAAVTLRKANKL